MKSKLFGKLTLISFSLAIFAALLCIYIFFINISLETEAKNGKTVQMNEGKYLIFVKGDKDKVPKESSIYDITFQNNKSNVGLKKSINPHPFISESICFNDDCYQSIDYIQIIESGDYVIKCSDKFSYAYKKTSEEKENFQNLTQFIWVTIIISIVSSILLVTYIILKINKK